MTFIRPVKLQSWGAVTQVNFQWVCFTQWHSIVYHSVCPFFKHILYFFNEAPHSVKLSANCPYGPLWTEVSSSTFPSSECFLLPRRWQSYLQLSFFFFNSPCYLGLSSLDLSWTGNVGLKVEVCCNPCSTSESRDKIWKKKILIKIWTH